VKISKKNQELANHSPMRIAEELQKRDDKIRELRAELKQIHDQIQAADAQARAAEADDYTRSMASFAAKVGE